MKNLLSISLATLLLLIAGCSADDPQLVEYQVPVVSEFKVLDEPVWPSGRAVLRYRIAMESVFLPADISFPLDVNPLAISVSDGEVVPLLPQFADEGAEQISFEDAETAWSASGGQAGYGTSHMAYREPFLYFLYQAPAHEQNVRVELNLGRGGGPGGRQHSDAFLVQWPFD